MISFENVDKFILANMCVHIPKGVTVGLIGATGSGKTTFIKLICGLLAPDKGNVYVMDHEPVSMLGKREAELGVLFAQLPSLQTEETVVNNFHSLKLIYRLKESFFEKSYKTLSERLGFGGFQYEKIGNLSMGQRRRAELGAALIHNPRLLLLDEPTIGLDMNGKEAIRALIKEREAKGLTNIVTSHDMSDISDVCSRICILDKGRICYYGRSDILFRKYAPVDVMQLTLQGGIPDIEDLPVKSYHIDGDKLKLIYNSNQITSAEILKVILSKASIKEVSIKKPNLADVIMKIERGIADEQFY
ncbi:MAG: ABC transporter ATP-binding protein [Lachnospiraceae bacterium]|nr:ABC transporter ATP-binding protein [Lachnospiraceae bacterium]